MSWRRLPSTWRSQLVTPSRSPRSIGTSSREAIQPSTVAASTGGSAIGMAAACCALPADRAPALRRGTHRLSGTPLGGSRVGGGGELAGGRRASTLGLHAAAALDDLGREIGRSDALADA